MVVVKAKSDFAANRAECLYDAMKQKKYCDAIFFVRNRSYYVHMLVLSTCSEFFVKNQYKLSATFSPFEFDVIDAILKYCYTGVISINEHHYEKFIELANLLEMKVIQQYKTVNISNCLEVLRETDDLELKTRAMDFTVENFETLHKTQDFLNLSASTVIEILKSDDLKMPSEEDVFNSVKLWVNYNDASRKNYLVQLMSSVRLSLISSEFLVKEVMEFCYLCAKCMDSLRQVVLDRINKLSIQSATLRGPKQSIGIVGGKNLEEANNIDIYDGQNKRWDLIMGIEIDKCRFASVVVGDWIVIIGGMNSKWESLTSVEYIDLKNHYKIQSLKPLNRARTYFSAVSLRRNSSTDVYAIGGVGSTNSVERWNSRNGDWKFIAPLLTGIDCHSASVIGNNIYVTGGRAIENEKYISTNKVQMYSVESNSWTYRADMIQERQDHSSVVFEGKLFVAGGFSNQTDTRLDGVEKYDPIENKWTPFIKLPLPASGISLCCFRNKILCMGGTGLLTVWEYDKTSESWKTVTSLSRHKNFAVAHVIPNDSIKLP
ncbi:kelch-like protein 25 [Arctopsyche grandis]|uniref:kelch-like protein 25 n=1 Tax=Arctopsyche grandis TaxID=121162 RepID=UPI00406D6BBF